MGWIICEIKSVLNEAQTIKMREFRAEPYNANSNTTGVYLIAHIPTIWEEKIATFRQVTVMTTRYLK